MTPRRLRFVGSQVTVMLAIALSLVLLGSFRYDLFFLLSLVSFMVMTELTASYAVTPRWRTRLTKVVAVGLLGFGLIALRHAIAVLRSVL